MTSKDLREFVKFVMLGFFFSVGASVVCAGAFIIDIGLGLIAVLAAMLAGAIIAASKGS